MVRYPSDISDRVQCQEIQDRGLRSFDVGNGREAILATSGRTCHILRDEDGTFTVVEDEYARVFPNGDDALGCAREIAGDPDLPPAHADIVAPIRSYFEKLSASTLCVGAFMIA